MDSIERQHRALVVAFRKNDEIRPINLLRHFPQAVHEWRGENGQNALHEAVMRDWQNLACRLVERPDVRDLMYHKDWSNATPLITAFKMKSTATVEFLLDNGAAGPSPLIWAWNNNCITFANYLIDSKCYLNCCDMDGTTPLLWAAKRNDQYDVKRLLVAGAFPEPIHRNYMTPLIWAVQTPQPTIVQLLLEAARPPISLEDISNARKVAYLLKSPHSIFKHLDLASEERSRRARP